jgi:hypothetical protein
MDQGIDSTALNSRTVDPLDEQDVRGFLLVMRFEEVAQRVGVGAANHDADEPDGEAQHAVAVQVATFDKAKAFETRISHYGLKG